MADDLAVLYTDKKVQTLEKKLKKVYKQAEKDIDAKLKTFTEKSAAKEKAYLQKVANGTMSQEAFDHWKQGQVFYGENWKAQQKSIAKVLSNANSVANDMINGEKADVFAFAGNYTAYDMEHGFNANFGFDLYSEKSVERLVRDNPKILPKPKVNIPKDERWNMQNIRSQVTQGIIQGESIPKIAKRLSENVTNRNAKQMTMHARTAMTSAQNGGRQERYKEAQALGIKFHKVWLATLDSRTRDTHQDLDGQSVLPDEYFQIGKDKILFPGDPNAEPALVYNCRCTLITKLDDYPAEYKRRAKNEAGDGYDIVPGDMTYNQWAAAKAKIGNVQTAGGATATHKPANSNMCGYEYGVQQIMSIDKNGQTRDYKFTVTKDPDHKFPDGTAYGTYQVRDADIFELEDGTKFIMPSDMDLTQQDMTADYFMERYLQLPDGFRGQIQKEIYIVDYRNPKDAYWEKQYHMSNFRSYATGGQNITFYAYTNHDDAYVVRTFAHEGGHYIDTKSKSGTRYSERASWRAAQKADEKVSGRQGVSSYALVHVHEDFAESMGEYVTNKQMMERDFPERTKIIEGILNGKR